jgi:NADPH:quinone reductase
MKAIRLHEYGPAANLRLETLPDLVPGAGQVRVAVVAAGVHLIDAELREKGAAGSLPAAPLPMVPGREVAGTVDLVGPTVAESWLGQRVVVHLGAASGGYAEQAIATVTDLFVLPDSLGFDAAVAMVGTGRTAMGILEIAQLSADDLVLVTAAAGGIGNLLVQEALAVGAEVIGAAGGPRKTEVVRGLGAQHAIDYSRDAGSSWPDATRNAVIDRPITVTLDGVGGEIGTAAMNLLSPGGRLVMFGWSSGGPSRLSVFDLMRLGISATVGIGARVMARPGGLRPLQQAALDAAASGRWVPLIGPGFALADARAAHVEMVERRTIGKTILRP